MDLSWSLVVEAICCFLLLRAWFSFSASRRLKLPPSPPSLPIIGHLHLLARGGLPHHFFAKLANEWGPLVHLQLGCKPVILVSDPSTAREVLKLKDSVFAFRPPSMLGKIIGYNYNDLGTGPYGKKFVEMKKVLTTLILSAKSLREFGSVLSHEMTWMVSELHASSVQKRPVQMREYLTALFFNLFTRMTLGKRYYGVPPEEKQRSEDGIKFHRTIDMTLRFALEGCIADFFPWLKCIDWKVNRMKEVHQAMDQFLQATVDEHRAAVRNDILSRLLEVMGEDEQKIKGLLYDILTGGTDTTKSILEWAFAHLMRNKAALSKVQHEIDSVIGPGRRVIASDIDKLPYLKAIVKETLRLHPPLPLLGHFANQACTVAGYDVQYGTWTFINLYAIGRNPRIWEEPLEFKPDRFIDGPHKHVNIHGEDFELTPFGSGRRACPASLLGMINVQLTLATLLHCFNWEVEKEVDLMETRGVTTLKLHPLELTPTPRMDVRAVYCTL